MIEAERALEVVRTISWSTDAEGDVLCVSGWPPATLEALAHLDAGALAERFAVLPVESLRAGASMQTLQPVAGRLEVRDDAVCFVPRWPFVAGMEYAFVERLAAGGYDVVSTSRRPAVGIVPTTEVLGIYPSAAELPLNLLKIYIHFSAPMSEGQAVRAVRVRNTKTGEELADLFLPNSLELWDATRTRLTLLLDPGRIKRGLLPHQQMGYPLTEGVPVTFDVKQEFHDALGTPLRASAERGYDVVAPVRARVEPALWQVSAPRASTRSPLEVAFDRPLDRALLEHTLAVLDSEGRSVLGEAEVARGERGWRLVPAEPWAAGDYTLSVDGHLEDLAGNSIVRVFDRDLLRAEDTPIAAESVAIHFAIS